MPKNPYTLGTENASKQLLRDLYIDLRAKANFWSALTKQTPQARMGYIGQHLVSVVTGYQGARTGARGRDLILPENAHGEIKTCYRVDQLGSCKDCHAAVSSIEAACSICGSENIDRKKDSKWLINIRDDAEFSRILEPAYYYFVLFEPIENHSDVQVSIWQADPKTKGFAYMLMDYYLNIRPASESHAALDLWPYHIKFCLTQPTLIYRSTITAAGKIKISVFPTRGNTRIDELPSLDTFAQSTTLKRDLLVSLVTGPAARKDQSPDQLQRLLSRMDPVLFPIKIDVVPHIRVAHLRIERDGQALIRVGELQDGLQFIPIFRGGKLLTDVISRVDTPHPAAV